MRKKRITSSIRNPHRHGWDLTAYGTPSVCTSVREFDRLWSKLVLFGNSNHINNLVKMTSYVWVTKCPQLHVNIGCFREQFSRVILHWVKIYLWFLLWPWKHHLRIKNRSDVYKLKLYWHVFLRLYLIVICYDM